VFYKKFSFKIVVRIAFILANILAISFIFGDDRLFFNQIILCVLLIIQIAELLRFVKQTNRELSKFLLAIKHQDFSINFQHTKLGSSFDELNNALVRSLKCIKKTKLTKRLNFNTYAW
jgi:two-component system, NtrC family, nitrogen regulation sensor histidine kinase NtrY